MSRLVVEIDHHFKVQAIPVNDFAPAPAFVLTESAGLEGVQQFGGCLVNFVAGYQFFEVGMHEGGNIGGTGRVPSENIFSVANFVETV